MGDDCERFEQRLRAVEAHPRLNDKLAFGWTRWTWMTVGYVALWLGVVTSLYVHHLLT